MTRCEAKILSKFVFKSKIYTQYIARFARDDHGEWNVKCDIFYFELIVFYYRILFVTFPISMHKWVHELYNVGSASARIVD